MSELNDKVEDLMVEWSDNISKTVEEQAAAIIKLVREDERKMISEMLRSRKINTGLHTYHDAVINEDIKAIESLKAQSSDTINVAESLKVFDKDGQ